MNTKQNTEKYAPDMAYNEANKDFSALKVRLDTSDLIKQIHIFLSGERTHLSKDKDGNITQKTYVVGERLLNDLGVHRIMMRVQTTINTHMAQANFDKDEYYRIISDLHESIADDLFINMENYDLKQENYSPLVDNIIIPIRIFLTRPVDNEERRSFLNWLRYGETNTLKANEEDRRGWVPKFFK